MVRCNQQGNQVRICNKSFADFIGTTLANKGEIIKKSCCIMKFKFNQMMHFYKFYTFYRDQNLETE